MCPKSVHDQGATNHDAKGSAPSAPLVVEDFVEKLVPSQCFPVVSKLFVLLAHCVIISHSGRVRASGRDRGGSVLTPPRLLLPGRIVSLPLRAISPVISEFECLHPTYHLSPVFLKSCIQPSCKLCTLKLDVIFYYLVNAQAEVYP